MISNTKPNLSGPAGPVYFGPTQVDLGNLGATVVGVLPDSANRLVPLTWSVVFNKEVGTLTTPAIATVNDGTTGHTVASSTTFTSAAQDRVFPMAIPANAYTITDSETQNFTFLVTQAAVGSTTTFRERTDNIATLTTAAPHGYVAGDIVTIILVGDNSYNQQYASIISAPTTTTFTYYSEGTDEASTADTAGVVSSSTALVYGTALLF